MQEKLSDDIMNYPEIEKLLKIREALEANRGSKFDYCYSLLLKLKEQNLSVNLTANDKIKINEDGTLLIIKKKMKTIKGKQFLKNKDEYNDASLILVGSWLYYNQSKLNDNQKNKLRQVGYKLKEDRKKKYIESKKKYTETSEFTRQIKKIESRGDYARIIKK